MLSYTLNSGQDFDKYYPKLKASAIQTHREDKRRYVCVDLEQSTLVLGTSQIRLIINLDRLDYWPKKLKSIFSSQKWTKLGYNVEFTLQRLAHEFQLECDPGLFVSRFYGNDVDRSTWRRVNIIPFVENPIVKTSGF